MHLSVFAQQERCKKVAECPALILWYKIRRKEKGISLPKAWPKKVMELQELLTPNSAFPPEEILLLLLLLTPALNPPCDSPPLPSKALVTLLCVIMALR